MCGRYVPGEDAAIERVWKIDRRNSISNIIKRFNVAPTLQVPVVLLEPDGASLLTDARWGLVPFWWKKPTPPPSTFNCRSEEATKKPMWRNSLKTHRCLMPAVGWYEWNEKEPAVSPAGKACNQPYYHYSPNSELLAIAGIWSMWNRPDAGLLLSCALLTKNAAPSVAAVHHRMPVILKPEYYSAWIDPQTSPADVQDMIRDSRDDFQFHSVSTRVNHGRNEGADLCEPLNSA